MADLNRFISAQERDYEDALKEIKRGYKMGHWIWYIFPQVKGLGLSSMSEYYGISSRQEAGDYLAHPILNQHLREITVALLQHVGKLTAWEILGTTDAMKVRSCMTLFDAISPNDIYARVLHNFYEDVRCEKTLQMLSSMSLNRTTRIAPDNIQSLKKNEVFVFGSNLQGRHVGGAAHFAHHNFGAVWGVGEGLTSHCYALPTMEGETSFRRAVATFIDCAKQHPNLIFLVTAVGCGIAGYSPKEVAPMFQDAVNVPNVYLPKCFWDVIEGL